MDSSSFLQEASVNIFLGLIVELIVAIVAWRVKDASRRVAVLAIGTLVAGLIAAGSLTSTNANISQQTNENEIRTANGSPTQTPIRVTGNWKLVGFPDENVSDIAQLNDNTLYVATLGHNHGIFKSTDGGLTWNAVNNGLGNLNVYDIEIFRRTDNIPIIVATQVGLWVTMDYGENWEPYGPDDAKNSTFTSIASLSNFFIIAVGPSNGYFSVNSGIQWDRVEKSGQLVAAREPVKTFYQVLGNKIRYWQADGNTWRNLADVGASYNISALAVNYNDAALLYACTGKRSYTNKGLEFSSGNGLYKSTNGGGSWSPVNNGLPNQGFETICEAILLHPQNSNLVFVVMNSQLFQSQDGGVSWKSLGNLPEGVGSVQVIFVHTTQGKIYIGTTNGLWSMSLTN